MSLFDSAVRHRGDELGNLLEFYRPYLLRLAENWIDSDLRPKFSASDAVQQATFAAAIGFETFEGTTEREFRKWLVTVLQNQLVDGWRWHRAAEKRDIHREQPGDFDDHPDPTKDAADVLAGQESISRLLTAIEEMPPNLRSIVRRRYLEGLSFEEIARQSSSSRESVRRRWKEALHQLGRQLRGRDD